MNSRQAWDKAELAIMAAQRAVDVAILSTPTSETRNLLTEANLKLMQAGVQLQHEEVSSV